MESNVKYMVYMHTTPNDKKYIGITSKNIKERYGYGSGYTGSKYFYNAIKKYGWDNIKHEILFEGLTYEEACEKEIELIAKYKTQQREFGYNITKGGEGHAGVVTSQETIEKLRKSHLGHKASEETKRRQSEAMKKHHAEHPVSEETKRKIGAKHKGKIMSVASRRKMSISQKNSTYDRKGKRKLTEEEKQHLSEINSGDKHPKAVKVICLDTLKVYNSILSASIDTHSNKTSINGVCKGRHYTANNLHWAYYDSSKPIEYYKELLRDIKKKKEKWFNEEHRAKLGVSKRKKVICLETQIIYDSITDASKATGINYLSICHCCKGLSKTADKQHWMYYDETISLEKYKKSLLDRPATRYTGRIPVCCIETGIRYESAKQAERILGIHHSSICRCCLDKRKTAGGYHWRYAD